MSTHISNPFSTGGGGTGFEWRVGACYLATLLVGNAAEAFGLPLESVRFQGRVTGAHLDDVILTGRSGGLFPQMQLQVRHSLRFSQTNAKFVSVMSEAWTAFRSQSFDARAGDRLGIIVGSYSSAVKDVAHLARMASDSLDAGRFRKEVETPGFSNSGSRRIFDLISDAISQDSSGDLSDEALLSFLKQFVIIHMDLDGEYAKDAVNAWNNLLRVVDDACTAQNIYRLLVEEVSRLAPVAGTIDADTLRVRICRRLPQLVSVFEPSNGLAERAWQVSEVFVPPTGYERLKNTLASSRLAMISGPPHVGKTATAIHLANWAQKEFGHRAVVLVHPEQSLSAYWNHMNAVLVLDDVFGASRLMDASRADRFDDLRRLSRTNRIIMTTREEILREAQSQTRLSEVTNLDTVSFHIFQEGSYDQSALEKMVAFHLKWSSSESVPPNERLSTFQLQTAESNIPHIANELRFPHNIERFVSAHLPTVDSRHAFFREVKNAAAIKRAVASWLNKRNAAERWFAITIALFQGLPSLLITRVYAECAHRMSFSPDETGVLVSRLSAYIEEPRHPRFGHPT